MSKHGGNLGDAGCVSWMFTNKGYILVEKSRIDEDSLMAAALEAGAEDMKNDPKEDSYEIISSPEDMVTIKDALRIVRNSCFARGDNDVTLNLYNAR